MKNKGLIILIIIVLLFIPIPLKLKDGGSIQYKAIFYNVTKIHRFNEKISGYEDGWKIEVLGIQVYNVVDISVNVETIDKYELISDLNTCVNCYNYVYEFEDGTKVYSSCNMMYKTSNIEMTLYEAIEKELIALSDLEKHGGFKIVKPDDEECFSCCT